MAIGAFCERVGETLARAHALFGDPPEFGAPALAASRLSSGADRVHFTHGRINALSGDFATGYGVFAAGAGADLDGLAGADDRLDGQLSDAVDADRSGRAASGTAIRGAARDTAALGPVANTPAGERALLSALRSRVAEQQRVIAAYRLRDARIAARLRSLAYARGGVVPRGLGMPCGGGGFGAPAAPGDLGMPTLPAVPQSSGRPQPERIILVGRGDTGEVAGDPGAVAAEAALSRRGTPYVWGAKGPSAFDCSGLTQWSWAQAGLHLGGDTYTQINEGMPVPPDQVRAGDLIFPTSSFGSDGPGHVQLAISPTQVVHAPQSGDVVRIAPMPPSFVARRPVPQGDT